MAEAGKIPAGVRPATPPAGGRTSPTGGRTSSTGGATGTTTLSERAKAKQPMDRAKALVLDAQESAESMTHAQTTQLLQRASEATASRGARMDTAADGPTVVAASAASAQQPASQE